MTNFVSYDDLLGRMTNQKNWINKELLKKADTITFDGTDYNVSNGSVNIGSVPVKGVIDYKGNDLVDPTTKIAVIPDMDAHHRVLGRNLVYTNPWKPTASSPTPFCLYNYDIECEMGGTILQVANLDDVPSTYLVPNQRSGTKKSTIKVVQTEKQSSPKYIPFFHTNSSVGFLQFKIKVTDTENNRTETHYMNTTMRTSGWNTSTSKMSNTGAFAVQSSLNWKWRTFFGGDCTSSNYSSSPYTHYDSAGGFNTTYSGNMERQYDLDLFLEIPKDFIGTIEYEFFKYQSAGNYVNGSSKYIVPTSYVTYSSTSKLPYTHLWYNTEGTVTVDSWTNEQVESYCKWEFTDQNNSAGDRFGYYYVDLLAELGENLKDKTFDDPENPVYVSDAIINDYLLHYLQKEIMNISTGGGGECLWIRSTGYGSLVPKIDSSLSMLQQSSASGFGATAIGNNTQANGSFSFTMGTGTTASGTADFIYGQNNQTNTYDGYNIVGGMNNSVSGSFNNVNGQDQKVNSTGALVGGRLNTLSGTGTDSIVYGHENLFTNGDNNIIIGYSNGKSGLSMSNSMLLGQGNDCSGNQSMANGYGNYVSGTNAHAEGVSTSALTNASHTNGQYTIASGLDSEFACGVWNKSQTGTSGTIFSVGIGTSTARKNGLDVRKNGDIHIQYQGNDAILQDLLGGGGGGGGKDVKSYDASGDENQDVCSSSDTLVSLKIPYITQEDNGSKWLNVYNVTTDQWEQVSVNTLAIEV